MKFILPETRFAKTCITALFAALLLTTGLQAQTKKKTASAPAKKTVAKKSTASSRDAKKSSKKEAVAKKSTKADPRKKTTAAKSKRETARED